MAVVVTAQVLNRYYDDYKDTEITFPDMQIANPTATIEHEATTSKINEDQLFYCQQRGIGMEDAVGLIVNGYAKEVMDKLPMEFAVEAQKLLQVSLEGSVG